MTSSVFLKNEEEEKTKHIDLRTQDVDGRVW